jgi:hypothetical protein
MDLIEFYSQRRRHPDLVALGRRYLEAAAKARDLKRQYEEAEREQLIADDIARAVGAGDEDRLDLYRALGMLPWPARK